MATVTRDLKGTRSTAPAVVVRAVRRTEPALVCSDCMYHIPHATRPGGWCACKDAKLRWQPVDTDRAACDAFDAWPDSSPAPGFIAAMRF